MAKDKEKDKEKDITKDDIKTEETVSPEEAQSDETVDEVAEDEPALSKEEELEAQIKELKDRLLRNLAEFDNFRKRTTAEKSAMYSLGACDTAEKLLPVLDNFERALASEPDKEGGFYKGVEMIFKQMLTAFEAIGIEEIEAEGATFDPNLHNAVMHIENESLGENVVSQVLQKGYKYKDRVIRPAMVQVAN